MFIFSSYHGLIPQTGLVPTVIESWRATGRLFDILLMLESMLVELEDDVAVGLLPHVRGHVLAHSVDGVAVGGTPPASSSTT